jgi:hypothetical protein
MADVRCSCGFTESGDETLTDHLLDVFVPGDSRAADGQVHEELAATSACACGVATTTPAELDQHFLAAFTPADSVGCDGVRHAQIRQSLRRLRDRLPAAPE